MDYLLSHEGSLFIYGTALVGLFYSSYQIFNIQKIEVKSLDLSPFSRELETVPLVDGVRLRTREEETNSLIEVSNAISEGSNAFLKSQYFICSQFIGLALVLIFFLISLGQHSYFEGALTAERWI